MTIRVENQLGLSQSLLDRSCVDGFAAGHSILYSSSDGTHDISGPFRHFGIFFYLKGIVSRDVHHLVFFMK
jgi:hypothetical protein